MDPDSELPADLGAFLYSCIDSVDQVDLLIRLRASKTAKTVRQLPGTTGLPSASVRRHLETLVVRGLLRANVSSEVVYRYAPEVGCAVAALIFFRFWRQSLDRFFLLFALAFLILTVDYSILGLVSIATEWRVYVFAFRLFAFSLIVVAIALKNRT